MKRASTLTILKMLRPFLKEVPLRQWFAMYHIFRNEYPHWFNNQVRINTFFPPFPSKAFDRFFQAVIGCQRIPYHINLAVTSACPFYCPHCSYGKRASTDLSTEQLLELIQEMKELGNVILGFTGGEPMLRNDLEELIAATNPEMTTVIFTTGYKLDQKRAVQLADAGVGCVTIGIESADPKKHDTVRGKKGSFHEGEAAIKACHKAGIYTAISIIGTRERIKNGELERMYQLGRKWNIGEMRIITPGATGNWAGCAEKMLTSDELQYLKEFHIKHNRSGNGPCVASFAYIESAEMFGCNAGYHSLFIDASGEVCPCDLTPLSFGNITKVPLTKIWTDMGEYFPQPRLKCLLGDIASKISRDKLPLPLHQSKEMIPRLDDNAQVPKLFRRLLR